MTVPDSRWDGLLLITMWIVLIMLVVLVILSAMPIRIEANVTQDRTDTDGLVTVVTAYGLVRIRRRLLSVRTRHTREGTALEIEQVTHGTFDRTGSRDRAVLTAEEVWGVIRNWQSWARLLHSLWGELKGLLRHVHVTTLSLRAVVGTGDVVSTGMACGAMWTVLATAAGRLSFLTRFTTKPAIHVSGDFNQPGFRLETRCIAHVRLGYAIVTVIRAARLWRRRTRNGTSDSRPDEDRDGKYPRNGGRKYDYRRSG